MRKKGQRVYMELENPETGETRRRFGTLDDDDRPFWDYSAVRFDDIPDLVQAVLCYYLFDDESENEPT